MAKKKKLSRSRNYLPLLFILGLLLAFSLYRGDKITPKLHYEQIATNNHPRDWVTPHSDVQAIPLYSEPFYNPQGKRIPLQLFDITNNRLKTTDYYNVENGGHVEGSPSVSPNLKYTAFIRDTDRVLMLLSHQTMKAIKLNVFGCVGEILGWTPDSSKIYFTSPEVARYDTSPYSGYAAIKECVNTTETGNIVVDITTGDRFILTDRYIRPDYILNYPYIIKVDKQLKLQAINIMLSTPSAKIVKDTSLMQLPVNKRENYTSADQISISSDLKKIAYLRTFYLKNQYGKDDYEWQSTYYDSVHNYQIDLSGGQWPLISPSGNFVAYQDGLYDTKTKKKLKLSGTPIHWIDDERLIIAEKHDPLKRIPLDQDTFSIRNILTKKSQKIN